MNLEPTTDSYGIRACTGHWRETQVIHGNIHIFRCSGCRERKVIYRHWQIAVPAEIQSPKAIVQYIRTVTKEDTTP